ncbi:SEC-C metal-binding domain-containing protein [Bacillus velezensis]
MDIGRNAPCHCGSGKNIKIAAAGQNSLDCMKRT